jgi:hypothetical protein
MIPSSEWEQRLAALWAALDEHGPQDFVDRMQTLVAELPSEHPVACFELASANDSKSFEGRAEPLYRRALANSDSGLSDYRRRRATIQLASTLRNLGQAEEGIALLTAERERGSDELDDAIIATLALCLTEVGRAREAAGLAIGALARHLPRYNRSMANYARALLAS